MGRSGISEAMRSVLLVQPSREKAQALGFVLGRFGADVCHVTSTEVAEIELSSRHFDLAVCYVDSPLDEETVQHWKTHLTSLESIVFVSTLMTEIELPARMSCTLSEGALTCVLEQTFSVPWHRLAYLPSRTEARVLH